jgi:hypothetical protein
MKKEAAKGKNKKTTKENGVNSVEENGVETNGISNGEITANVGVYQRSNKYQFHNLWFDPTRARTHDLQHLR